MDDHEGQCRVIVNDAPDDDRLGLVTTVTRREDGLYRVERGSSEQFYWHENLDDEPEGERAVIDK